MGRSGHTITGTPKGRLFPLTRDELVEAAAIMDSVRRGELDRIIIPEQPLDVLAQQIIAEVGNCDFQEDDLYHLVRRAYPYRNLAREEFDGVVAMLAEGYTPRRGRKHAYIQRDLMHGAVKGRRGARINALMSGGTIPDQFDYDVIMEPTETFIGTLNEDFAIESTAGDIVQLGNNSWRILRVEKGKIRVEDAQGMPPTMPFWFGEAPGRTAELSASLSRLREEVASRIDLGAGDGKLDADWKKAAEDWLMESAGVSHVAATQIAEYLGATRAALGVIPSQKDLVAERFFDEAGDMHLVLHSPFGSRVNRAWGLALRKRFCRTFNFELQAAANEDSIILSLGATHSFPLDDVFRYLNAKSVREVLVQALLDAPMFEVRWRWNASTALAVLRRRGGDRVPPQIQRSVAEDLIAQVFPDQIACLENIAGDREVPDHPLVTQTIEDCLHEAMDVASLEAVLKAMKAGEMNVHARDLREPSPMAEEILNARPYAFLDDAPLEERRTNAVRNRRWLDPAVAGDLGRLDPEAIDTVRGDAWPEVRSPDELHDALVLAGYVTEEEGKKGDQYGGWTDYYAVLESDRRAATLVTEGGKRLWAPLERRIHFERVHPRGRFEPAEEIPAEVRQNLEKSFQSATGASATDGAAAAVGARTLRPRVRRDASVDRAAVAACDHVRPLRVRGGRGRAGGTDAGEAGDPGTGHGGRAGRVHRSAGGQDRTGAVRAGARGIRLQGTVLAGRGRAGMVRTPAPGADPPLHDHQAPPGDPARFTRRLHAVPLHLASPGARYPAEGGRRRDRGAAHARRRGGAGGGVGERDPAFPRFRLRLCLARQPVPLRQVRLGTAPSPPFERREREDGRSDPDDAHRHRGPHEPVAVDVPERRNRRGRPSRCPPTRRRSWT